MPKDKEFKSIEDQIRLLKERKLKFNDLANAKKHLLTKNYFNLVNGFETLLLTTNDSSSPKIYVDKTFDDFIRLYNFDSKLSSLIFKSISEFETKLKTSIAYRFCKNHCSTLRDNNNYIDIDYYKVPDSKSGPPEFVDFFFDKCDSRKTHKLFRSNYYYFGIFDGNFEGQVKCKGNKTILKGVFSGRFGSTSIKTVTGSCSFYNNRQPFLSKKIKSLTSTNSICANIYIKNERIYGLNFIDSCKTQFPYVNEYNNPPFWVTIKTLMLNDIIILLYGLKKITFDAVLRDFQLKPELKTQFLNSLEIIKELRNNSAHFELISFFKTSSGLKINKKLISRLGLTTENSQYSITLYDVLKILGSYVDLSEVKLLLLEFWYAENKLDKTENVIALYERMGNSNINDWIENI